MRVTRRAVIEGASGVAAASVLAGCFGDDDGPAGDARLWHSLTEGETESLDEFVGTFNDETDWEIATESISSMQDKTETSLAAGDGPELYSWAHDWVADHDERDLLYDASDDLSIDVEEEFSQAGAEAVQSPQGNVVGLPIAGETPTLLYNREMIDEPPETLDEMESIMEAHHDPSGGSYGLAQPINGYFASAWIQTFGGFYFRTTDDGERELGLERSDTHEGMELLRDRIDPYIANDYGIEAQESVFGSGKAPMIVDGPWAVGNFRDMGVDVGVAPLPEVDGNSPSPYTGIDMWYFTARMGEDEERREAAIDFAEWYTTTEDIHLELAETHSYIPVHSSIEPDALPEEVAAFTQTFEAGTAMPTDAGMNTVWEPTQDAITSVLNDDAEIADAFSAAADTIREQWGE